MPLPTVIVDADIYKSAAFHARFPSIDAVATLINIDMSSPLNWEALPHQADGVIIDAHKIPLVLPDNLTIRGCTQREDARLQLITHNPLVHFENFNAQWKIGVTNVLTAYQLQHYFSYMLTEVVIIPDKALHEWEHIVDGLLLPAYWVKRNNWSQLAVQKLSLAAFEPEAGAGIVGMVGTKNTTLQSYFQTHTHQPTFHAWTAERALAKKLHEMQKIPCFAFGNQMHETLTLNAGYWENDQNPPRKAYAETKYDEIPALLEIILKELNH